MPKGDPDGTVTVEVIVTSQKTETVIRSFLPARLRVVVISLLEEEVGAEATETFQAVNSQVSHMAGQCPPTREDFKAVLIPGTTLAKPSPLQPEMKGKANVAVVEAAGVAEAADPGARMPSTTPVTGVMTFLKPMTGTMRSTQDLLPIRKSLLHLKVRQQEDQAEAAPSKRRPLHSSLNHSLNSNHHRLPPISNLPGVLIVNVGEAALRQV